MEVDRKCLEMDRKCLEADQECLEVGHRSTNFKLDLDSTPLATVPRNEVASEAELLLVSPCVGGKAKFVLIFWYRAFAIDNRVASINVEINQSQDWPEPYVLSKLIRNIVYPIKRCWLATKNALSNLCRTDRTHICTSYPTSCTEGDIELGERVRREEAKSAEEVSYGSPAKDEFRKSLQSIFSKADCVDRIMSRIDYLDYLM